MPKYLVKEKGFYNGRIYDPFGKRTILDTSEAFKKCPSWLEPIKAGKSAPKKTKPTKSQLDREQDEQNQRDIDAAVNFVEGPSPSGPVQVI